MSRMQAIWSYLLYFIPKIAYSVPALSLTEAECNSIQSTAFMVLLPKLHSNRHTARTIVFGQLTYGGLALPTLYGMQSYDQLKYCIGHICLGDTTGKLLLIALSYLQLISGATKPILQQDINQYLQWIKKFWMTSIWSFLSRTQLKLHIPGAWCPTPPRRHNIVLMDHFLCLKFSPGDMTKLNCCRLYLQVIYLSNIATADGTSIGEEYKVVNQTLLRKSKLRWPRQVCTPPSMWQLWNNALSHFESRGKLVVPLREWQQPSHQMWPWFVDQDKMIVYHHTDQDSWSSFIMVPCPKTCGKKVGDKTL